jgi:dCTP diphosphatase
LKSDPAVPIHINFSESEIGAVLVTVDQKKIKTRAVLVQKYKCRTDGGIELSDVGQELMSEIKALTEKIKKFRDERDWMKFHNHKDLALSLVLEAAEVLEHFQWKKPKEVEAHAKACKDEIADELADVAMYLFELADNLGIDLSKAIDVKLAKNAKKYPIHKARSNAKKYTEFKP